MDITSKILLVLVILICGATGYYSYKNSLEINELKEQAQLSQLKIDSLMVATAKIAKAHNTKVRNKQPRGFWEELFSAIEEEEKASAAAARKQEAAAKVRVSTSYHLEDRYVIGKVELPDVIGTQAGKITVNIFVNHSGTVKKTSIADGATITDPDVIEAVRRAALKTDFNSDYDAQDMAPGTITYTFVKK